MRCRGAVAALLPAALLLLSGCVAPRDDAPPAPPAAPAVLRPPPPVPRPQPVRLDLAATAMQGGVLTGTLTPAANARLTLDGADVPVAPDGRFLVAFDRDGAATAVLVAIGADGSRDARTLAITPGNWRVENIDARMTGGAATSAEFQQRRAGEMATIAAARTVRPDSEGWRQRFIWPAQGRVSGLFGSQRVYRGVAGAFHSGVDVAAGAGTPFVAPADGVVVLAAAKEQFTLEGHLLIIDHGMGLSSSFLHCSRLDVRVGDRVRQGQPLGLVGMTGRATGPHMHWGMKWRGARIDPQRLAGPMLP